MTPPSTSTTRRTRIQTGASLSAMLALRDVRFSYASAAFALNIGALSVQRGEKLALIGASGSGKTTLLRLIAGLLPAHGGQIYLAGQALHQLSETARRRLRATQIGFVLQELALLDYLDVFDNIVHAHRLNSALRLDQNVRQRALDLAAELGLSQRLRHRPAQLSGGERQRVAICRALLAQPQLILADEATGQLDPFNRQRALSVLLEMAQRHGSTVVAVTHDHSQLSQFDRVIDCTQFHG